MADYFACTSATCTRRTECARWRMQFGERQSYSDMSDLNPCTYFIALDDAAFKIVSLDVAIARAAERESA